MGIQILQVDAFTDRPFRGNPAAVCLLDEPADPIWMQQVAAEMNLSETAFLCRENEGYRLRWFTPAVEVDLCGHATLASAHTLWEVGGVSSNNPIEFYTRSGVLGAIRQGEWIELNFPAKPPKETTPPDGLLEALGVPVESVSYDGADYLVEVASESVVRQVRPDFVQLATLPVRGIIVTSLAEGDEYDFVSRFFAPAAGINEDPVTGSAHCALAPFWQPRLHRDNFLAYQASARGGAVRVQLKGDRVFLGGQAVTVMRGELMG
ncbi:MAG: PhzF family phenazine biosynthesis protein [Cyanobacteriota bacterium]|nr:PhzF family phenazine biosynthesis protein [Cyanobacteriota bacterium]